MVILHRYIGIAIGLVMWFVSGVVMMYVPYPRVQLRVQLPIPWQSCCKYAP